MAGMLRVSGGRLLRRQFLTPPLADQGLVRPTTDRIRQAIFSSIGSIILDAQALDLFAGSGAYSFESISRGATRSTLVEKNPDTAKCIQKNIDSLGLKSECQLMLFDAIRFIERDLQEFHVIFVDPPYTLHLQQDFWSTLHRNTSQNVFVIYRCFKKQENDFGAFETTRDQAYGNTRVFFLTKAAV